MAQQIPQNSFINLFSNIVYDKMQSPQKSLDIWDAYDVKAFPRNLKINPYNLYRPTEFDTLERIATNFYGSPRLWWITCIINEVEDPFTYLDSVVKNKIDDGYIKILRQEYISPILLELRKIKAINDALNERVNNE